MIPLTRRTLLQGAALATGLGVGAAVAAPDTALLTSTASDRAEKLVAAAKREGAVSLYTSIAQSDLKPLLDPFQARYGIKVTVWRASGDTVVQRVIQEQRAGRFTVDAVHPSSPELEALARENLLQPVVSPHFGDLVAGALPEHRLYVNTLLSVWVQAYNTDLVAKADLPRTYADLLDPRWKGKLGYEVEDIEWFTTVSESMGAEKGIAFFRDLVARNGLSVRKGHSLLNNLVVAGEVPLGLTLYNYMPQQAKRQGAPIDWFALEPAVARGNGVGVMKTAANPNAAALLVDYMLSEMQPLLAAIDYVPTSTKVPSPLGDVKVKIYDPSEKLDRSAYWEPLYQKIIIKQDAS